jgi:hypothetical protein
MIKKSQLFGTQLTVGPRLKKFIRSGYGDPLLWEEGYPDQEEATADGRGEFQRTREWIEKAPLEDVFDLWCRGQNLCGFADTILKTVKTFRRIVKR